MSSLGPFSKASPGAITVTTVPQKLPAFDSDSVTIQAHPDNTDRVRFQISGDRDGFVLAAGASAEIEVTDMNMIFVWADSGSQVVIFVGLAC